jgi:VWFA-related protein
MRNQGTETPRSFRGAHALRIVTITGLLLGSTLAMAAIDLQVRAMQEPPEVAVTVTDSYGTPIPDLDISRFTITEDSTSTAITEFSIPAGPTTNDAVSLSAVFVMDYSGSLVAANAVEPAEEAVVSFIESMNLGDRIAILKVNGTIADSFGGFAIVDPADTTALVEAARQDLPEEHGTHLYDAILQAYGLLESHSPSLPDGPKAVIVLTDGKDVESSSVLADVQARIEDSIVPLYPIGFANPDVDVMTSFAQAAGTTYVAGRDEDALQQIQTQLAQLLQNQYLVQFASSIEVGDCTKTASLTVTVDAGLPSEQTAQALVNRCTSSNALPTVQSVARKAYPIGRWVSLQIDAGDPDGDGLSFSATGLAPGLSINSSSGLISGVPSQLGTYVTRVGVSDGKSTSEVAFAVDVYNPPSGGGGAFDYLSIASIAGLLAFGLRRRKYLG